MDELEPLARVSVPSPSLMNFEMAAVIPLFTVSVFPFKT